MASWRERRHRLLVRTRASATKIVWTRPSVSQKRQSCGYAWPGRALSQLRATSMHTRMHCVSILAREAGRSTISLEADEPLWTESNWHGDLGVTLFLQDDPKLERT